MRTLLPTLLLLTALPAAGQTLRFEDATDDAGMTLDGRGHGVAVRDFNKDGWPDLYVAASRGKSALFVNRGDGTFEDGTAGSGLALEGAYHAPVWGDLNNDGWADLIVVGKAAPNKLFLSLGDGTFADRTQGSGIDPEAAAATVALGDFDADGLLDVFLAVDDAPDLLYRNLGGGRFEDVTARAAVGGPGHAVAMQAVWFDYDHNGLQDLFVVHDGFEDSRLHRNLGYLPLVDQARSTGFNEIGSGNSMGIAIGDVTGDGMEDVYVTRIGEAGLYINDNGKTFHLVDDALGAWRNGMSWGAVFSDFDNDADLDLFVVNTTGYDGTPTLLYEKSGPWFYDRSQSAGASLSTETQGLAALDYNLDGLVDLVMPDHNGRVRLLKGASESPGSWLRIQLEGREMNRDAIGARVEIEVNGQVLTRSVSGADSFSSQSEPVLHFGIGSAPRADHVRLWSVGSVQPEYFGALAAGNHLIRQGDGTFAALAAEPHDIPENQVLLEVYPRPLSADTRIRVRLPLHETARITVWDALGRQVALVSQGVLPAGSTEFEWAAEGLGTGIYFVRLETISGFRTTAVSKLR